VIHLDTSFLIRALVRGSAQDELLRAWLRGAEPLGISAVAWAEFLCGPVSPEAVELAQALIGEPAAFASGDAMVAADLFNRSGRRRGSLVDCMVAAAAIGADAGLATANPRDFGRLSALGLRLAPE
jgi:predicted nucleic acid-binding protein